VQWALHLQTWYTRIRALRVWIVHLILPDASHWELGCLSILNNDSSVTYGYLCLIYCMEWYQTSIHWITSQKVILDCIMYYFSLQNVWGTGCLQHYEKFEDIKGVIRIRKSKDTEENGQQKKDKQRSIKHYNKWHTKYRCLSDKAIYYATEVWKIYIKRKKRYKINALSFFLYN